MAVWLGAAALLLWAVACGSSATSTPTEGAGDVSATAVGTAVPEPTTAASPEGPAPTFTPIPEAPGTDPDPSPTSAPDMGQDGVTATAVVVTEAPPSTQAPENTEAPAPAMSSTEQPSTSTPVLLPTSTPTPAPPPTAAPTVEPAPDLPVGSNVGNRAPEFTLTLTEGRTLTSEDLRAEGTPVLLFFHSVT